MCARLTAGPLACVRRCGGFTLLRLTARERAERLVSTGRFGWPTNRKAAEGGRHGCGFRIMSTACRRSVPHAQRMIDYLEEALVELEAAAGIKTPKGK